MDKYILVIGELLIDAISINTVTSLSQATGLDIQPGGSAANFSRFLNYCETSSRLIASIGNDGFGKQLLNQLENNGTNTENILINKQCNTSLIIVGKTKETPDFIPYRDADYMITSIKSELINYASILHTTAFALSKEPAQSNILKALKTAHEMGINISIDWNFAHNIWGENNNAKEIFNKIQDFKPIFKFSLDDIERFTGSTLNINKAKEFLESVTNTAICLTCGSKGVYYKTNNIQWQYMEAQKIDVKDATGAGDAFWAGFISEWNKAKPIEFCVARGMHIASLKLLALI